MLTITAPPAAPQLVTAKARLLILRANALFLLIASVGGLVMDISGIFFSRGPESAVVAAAPFSGAGFIEAHGLAFIIGVLLWRAQPQRCWHLTGAAVALLLGTTNVVFWPIFTAIDFLSAGYITTTLHCLFVILQLTAAANASANGSKSK